MAEDNGLPANMDLEAILRTLASLPKPEDQPLQDPQTFYAQSQPGDDRYQTLAPEQHQSFQPPTADPRLAGRSPQPPLLPKPQARSSTPLIDPATIIDWKAGLRCVSKIAAQNPEFAASVRKLMKEQEGNVRQWEAGRTRLIEEQDLKKGNEETHRAALSLPGLLDNSPVLRTAEREQQELTQYDAKVYRASKAMVESQTSSLKVLGVPFFGVRPHLLASEDEEVGLGADGVPLKITQSQVLQLQRKMLTHLLDLYGD
ncbi:uncharacterized protein EKO05_0004689 [Ascochyta rabiei]|uniref:Uncharacterized protein n=1 Tax=Didymella rabiei TaxID=5454 RepID=A0A163KPD2_DIDRA|nr:uncharacterized protein EKO05_0004689 [Ascochyta rabiei]KZM27148.1 hypothetical protein ST47_g1682 [Ascochyta rabiei]UPX14199.1 hypothetical protein EKO05_0004689 [Ascochyta rabiei]